MNTRYDVSWELPLDNGESITSYLIEIKDAKGQFHEDIDHCDGQDTHVKD